MNYKIIQDIDKLQEFVNFLPDLEQDEKFYFCLFARKKYWPTIKADKGQIKRGLATKDNLIQKIRQLECAVGAYQFEGQDIPQEALAFYLMPNPRSLIRAARASLVRFAELIANDNHGYNPYQEVLSQIQKSKSRSIFLDFDFDQEEIPQIQGLNPESYRILKTRGGYHVLVELSKIEEQYKKTFHREISKLGPDVTGDTLLPAPGCCQGSFIPYFI